MKLPKTFVGFSPTDVWFYCLMHLWAPNERIPFDFADCQLRNETRTDDEDYIKSKVRQRLPKGAKYMLLIGENTKDKYQYVEWEVEVAIEKGCTLIGVYLDGSRKVVQQTCPPVIYDVGAIFIPFSPRIIAHTLTNYKMHKDNNYNYKTEIYRQLGYNE